MAARATMVDLIARVRLLIGDTVPGTAGQVPAPGTPTSTTAATGGTVAAGVYQVVATYVNVSGETTGSIAGAVTTTGSTSTITIPTPPPSGNASGWYAYVTQAGGVVATRQQTAGSPSPIGTALVLTAPPTSSGLAPPTANMSGATAFTDDNIQDRLDETRLDIRYEVLEPKPTYTPGGIQWFDYYSRYEHWEQGETLLWINFTTLTPVAPTISDRIIGHWGFSPSQLPAVLLAGNTYDVWLVSADLLDIRCVSLALGGAYDFSSDGQTFNRSQIVRTLQQQASQYRAKARPAAIHLVRGDAGASADDQRVARAGPVSGAVPFVTGP